MDVGDFLAVRRTRSGDRWPTVRYINGHGRFRPAIRLSRADARCYTGGVSLAALEPVLIVGFAVLAVGLMVLAVRAERGDRPGAAALRNLGVVCCLLAGLAYAVFIVVGVP